jgi:hypothetical protein
VGSPNKPELGVPDTGGVFEIWGVTGIREAGGWVWVGAPKGLYRWRVGSPDKPEPAGLDTGGVSNIWEAGGCLWVQAERGLFQIRGAATSWKTPIRLTKKFPDTPYPETPLPVAWEIEDYGGRTEPEIVRCRVLVYDSNSQDKKPITKELRGQFQATLDPLPAGDYRLVVEATDLWGEVARSEPLKFHVYENPWEVIGEWLAGLAVVYLGVNVLVFLGLVVASRWSGRSLRFLTSPWALRFGIYYRWALRNLPPLQVWVLTRYYRSARLVFEERTHPHVPCLLARPQPPGVWSTDLLDELWREGRIWVTGRPGTGKT